MMTTTMTKFKKYKKEDLFTFYYRAKLNPIFTLLHKEMSYMDDIFPTQYKAYKGYCKRYKISNSVEKVKGLNGIFIKKGNNYYPDNTPMNKQTSIVMYLHLLEFYNNVKDTRNTFDKSTFKVPEKQKQTYYNNFCEMFRDLLTYTPKSSLNKDNMFIPMLNDIDAASNDSKSTSMHSEFSDYLYKTFTLLFRRNHQKNRGLILITQTSLAFSLSDSILEYLVHQLKNTRLNRVLHELRPENYLKVKPITLQIILCFIRNAHDEVALKKAFTRIFKINLIYFDYLTTTILGLIHRLCMIYPRIVITLFEKEEASNIIDKFLLHDNSKASKINSVRLGKLLIQFAIKHGLCRQETLYMGGKTKTIITIDDPIGVLGLNNFYNYKPPFLVYPPIRPGDLNEYLGKKVNPKQLALYTIVFKAAQNKVHANVNTNLTYNLSSKEHNYTPVTKYTIDKSMLYHFLESLEKYGFPTLKTKGSPYDCIKKLLVYSPQNDFAENFLCLFDINFEFIDNLLQRYPNVKENYPFHKALLAILDYALNLHTLGYQDIKEAILGPIRTQSKFPGCDVIKSLLDKILQYKITFVGILRDVILYSKYKWFYARSFLDSRGRIYNDETYLNIQNNPIAKMFVKLYHDKENTMRPQDLAIIKTFINSRYMEHDMLPKECAFNLDGPLETEADLKAFHAANRHYVREYIYGFFKSSLSREHFYLFLKQCKYNKKDRILSFIKVNIKKIKQLWIVYQKIRCFVANHMYMPIELDANSSGSEMTAILGTDAKFATKCMLIGLEQHNAYEHAAQELKIELLKLKQILDDFNTTMMFKRLPSANIIKSELLLTSTIVNLYHEYKSATTLDDKTLKAEDVFEILLYADLTKSPGLKLGFLKAYYIYLDIVASKPLPESLFDLWYFVPKKELDLIKNIFGPSVNEFSYSHTSYFYDFCMYILVLRVAFNFRLYNNKFSWLALDSPLWDLRDLFKSPIMTLYYNAVANTRKNHFKDIIKDYGETQNQNIEGIDYTFLGNLLEAFFDYYSEKHLDSVSILKTLTSILCGKPKGFIVTIVNKFFTITLDPKKVRSIQVESKTLKGKTEKSSISMPSNEPLKDKLKQSLSPNLIHSMDGHIAHDFNLQIRTINRLLYILRNDKLDDLLIMKDQLPKYSKIKLPYIPYRREAFQLTSYTNHDTFALNMPALLPLILKDNYYNLMIADYLGCIQGITNEERKQLQKMDYRLFAKLFKELHNPKFVK